MNSVMGIIGLVIVLFILWIIYKVVSFLLVPALIVFAVAIIVYKFSGHNIFSGKNINDDKKDDK